MSTRSQIRFVYADAGAETEADIETVAQVYRHADGYPAGVLQDLRQCKRLLETTDSYRGVAYTAAVFVFLDKLRTLALYVDRDDRGLDPETPAALCDPDSLAALDQPLFLLGHGVENPRAGIHGDEEYLYEVVLPEPRPFLDAGEWRVRVSEHCGFPRWDGPTGEAFERVSWQFEGTLVEAVEAGLVDAR